MIGTTISHYKILSKLGEGGMGVVYKAHDIALDRDVALKFLPSRTTGSESDRARFLQEARAAAALNHPNICSVFDIQESGGQQYIVLELLEGRTLREISRSGRRLEIREVISCAIQIGEALAEAHAKGIVHRDVKSDNIMLTDRGQIKIMDFGLAKLKGALELTQAGSTAGTLGYMAPEQIQGREADGRSDIFSFGVVIFEMLTGRLPFRGEHEAAILYSIINDAPDSPAQFRDDVTPELERIIGRALEKDPDDRYQTAADMVSDIRRLQKARPSGMTTAVPPAAGLQPALQPGVKNDARRSGGRKTPFLIAGVILILAVLAGAYMIFFRGHDNPASIAVLPFVNDGNNPDAEYLSDGMTESIINSLARVPNVRVVPRSTVFRFKGKDTDPQEIGKQLNVGTILTGRIVQHGAELTVQVDLIDLRNQSQIWGDRLTRPINQIMTLQDDIVNSVTREMKVAVNPETAKDVVRHGTSNPVAYKLYLQGRFYWNKRRAADIERAIDYYTQATTLDPSYAQAYLGLAESYLLQEQYEGIPAAECYPKAEVALNKALSLDPNMGEAHAAMAFVKEYDWDWAGSEAEFRKAIALNPQYATSYHWYSILLHGLGRHMEAAEMIDKAKELDPLSPVIALNSAMKYMYTGELARADSEFLRMTELDRSFAPSYSMRARVLMRERRFSDAESSIMTAISLSGGTPETSSLLAYCYEKEGKKRQADSIIAALTDLYQKRRASAHNLAWAYAGYPMKDSILTWLERDCRDHSGWMIRIRENEFSPVFNEPRYRKILRDVGMEK